MSKGEAERMFRRGLRFRVGIGLNADPQAASAEKANRMLALNTRYNGRGITFSRGFWTHEHHVVIAGADGKYSDLCTALANEADGGRASAQAIRAWYTTVGGNRLANLTARQKMLAVLSHFSETSRGYGLSELTVFRAWISQIADAPSTAAAKLYWAQVKSVYAPSLTYAEDAARDWMPGSEDSSSGSDSVSSSGEYSQDVDMMGADDDGGPSEGS